MSNRQQSLRKRFPGQHVHRSKFWIKTGHVIEIEGPIHDIALELCLILLSKANHLTKTEAQAVARLTKRLQPKE